MLELVETVDKAILPLGYEVITGIEEGDIFNLVLSKRSDADEQ
jgi:phosphoribosylformylglycinamidine (FGAM) synthase PurS component